MKPRFLVTIRVSILTAFVSLLLLVVASNNLLGLTQMEHAIDRLSKQLLQRTTTSIVSQIDRFIERAQMIKDNTQQLVSRMVLDLDQENEINNYIFQLTFNYPDISAMYWADTQGNFIITRRQDDGYLNNFTITHTDGQPEVQHYHVKKSGELHKIKPKVTDQTLETYDPRAHHWYKMAMEKKEQVWTDAHVFFDNEQIGITSAQPIFDNKHKMVGVFAVDITLNSLQKFIHKLNPTSHANIIIFDDHGHVLSFSNQDKKTKKLTHMMDLKDPWLKQAFMIYKKSPSDYFDFEHDQQTYVAATQTLPDFKKYNWRVMTVLPKADLLGSVIYANQRIIMNNLMILMLGIGLVVLLSNKISQPIKKLAQQAKQIKQLRLDELAPSQPTLLKEVDQLDQAMQTMVTGLKSFQKYMPTSLVNSLIQTGEVAQVGGRNKYMTVMFADIEGFTQLSETMDPDQLINQLNQFFEIVNTAVTEQIGLIDKYIGDGVMAFWGAPVSDPKHAQHACQAALDIQMAMHNLQLLWQQEGKPVFKVRITIASGEMIVGNVGTNQRLSYSVMGDTVNLAKRLDGVNKLYGCDIITNEATYKACHNQLCFRLLDQIRVPGKAQELQIYHLMPAEQKQLAKCYQQGLLYYLERQWQQACEQFEQCHNDSAAQVMAKRCRYFSSNPPADDWDGIWHLQHK